MEQTPDYLILFDDRCNLCSWLVRYILKRDKKDIFRFGSLFSAKGKQIKKPLPWEQQKNTIIYFENNEVFTQSDAAIRILVRLGGIYSLFKAFVLIPKPVRDSIYKIIAKYRYRIFGRREKPMEPPLHHKWKFID
ncbi:MAG: DUF393 domain-containing protein [Bacteroidales bacterium]|nr:DUF393 domain-containing protein [Bacteroidales bacterium]